MGHTSLIKNAPHLRMPNLPWLFSNGAFANNMYLSISIKQFQGAFLYNIKIAIFIGKVAKLKIKKI